MKLKEKEQCRIENNFGPINLGTDTNADAIISISELSSGNLNANKSNIGEKIKNLRKIKAMTQKDLSFHLHIDEKIISNWEKNEVLPTLQDLTLLSIFFKVDIDYFIKKNDIDKQSDYLFTFKSISLACIIGMILIYFLSILFFTFSHDTTSKIFRVISFSMLPTSIAVVFFIYKFTRHKYLKVIEYNDKEKKIIYKITKSIYTTSIITIFMYAAIYRCIQYVHGWDLQGNNYTYMKFQLILYFIPASIMGILGFILSIFVSFIHRKIIKNF